MAVFLILVLLFVQNFTFTLANVCDVNDLDCLHPNINSLGTITFGKCNVDHVLRRVEPTTILECIKKCLKTANCTSVNYRQPWNICDINDGIIESSDLVDEFGCLFSYISDWPPSLAGVCAEHTCKLGHVCYGKDADGNFMCSFEYCTARPNVPNAEVSEMFGLYRNQRSGVKYKCREGYRMEGKPFAVCQSTDVWNILFTCVKEKPLDCSELTGQPDGVYRIYPDGGYNFDVFCDMSTMGGGWTVFQRRMDGSTDFYRDWTDYENGFGSVDHEFWLGNKYLSTLTAASNHSLLVIMTDLTGELRYAEFNSFKVNGADLNYSLEVSGYTGDAGDSLEIHNGMSFTTKDRDNDVDSDANCAVLYKGAWWYNACHVSNLNGLYLNGSHEVYAVGINWATWKGYYFSLTTTKMMIRRN